MYCKRRNLMSSWIWALAWATQKRETTANPILSKRERDRNEGITKSLPLIKAPLSASSLFLAKLAFFVTFHRCDKESFPWLSNGFYRRTHGSIVSELDVLPVDNFIDGCFATAAGRLGVNDLAVTNKSDAAAGAFYHLDGPVPVSQTTHLKNIDHVKEIGCAVRSFFGTRNGFEETFTVDWFGKDFGSAHDQPLVRGGITRQKKGLQSREDFA